MKKILLALASLAAVVSTMFVTPPANAVQVTPNVALGTACQDAPYNAGRVCVTLIRENGRVKAVRVCALSEANYLNGAKDLYIRAYGYNPAYPEAFNLNAVGKNVCVDTGDNSPSRTINYTVTGTFNLNNRPDKPLYIQGSFSV